MVGISYALELAHRLKNHVAKTSMNYSNEGYFSCLNFVYVCTYATLTDNDLNTNLK